MLAHEVESIDASQVREGRDMDADRNDGTAIRVGVGEGGRGLLLVGAIVL